MHHDAMARLFTKALAAGAIRKGVSRAEWDLSGRCAAPVPREIHVRPGADERDQEDVKADAFVASVLAAFPGATVVRDTASPDRRRSRAKYLSVQRGTKIPLTLLMHLRCRKCDWCRKQRATMWRIKAQNETRAAARTWFGTLTLCPAAHQTMVSRARVRLSEQGVDFDAVPLGEQFQLRHKECSIEITKYLKRIRKESGAQFRYLLVAEHHKSGLPHYHLLVHEKCSGDIKHATLSKQWLLGFEKWRVVNDLREATYLCKYLSKTNIARVRASFCYGSKIAKRENDPQTQTRFGLTMEDDNGLASGISKSSARSQRRRLSTRSGEARSLGTRQGECTDPGPPAISG